MSLFQDMSEHQQQRLRACSFNVLPTGPSLQQLQASAERSAPPSHLKTTLRHSEGDASFLQRLFSVMKREAAAAEEAAPKQHISGASSQHAIYRRSVEEKIDAILACITPRTRQRMAEHEVTSASSNSLFDAADRAGVPLRKVAGLRAIFTGKSSTEGIPEDAFLERFGSSLGSGINTTEARRFWVRSLDRNSDGSLSFNEMAAFLTLATDLKSSADLAGWFETGTFEQIPKMPISHHMQQVNDAAGKKVSKKNPSSSGGAGDTGNSSRSKKRDGRNKMSLAKQQEMDTLDRQRQRREYEEKFDASTRKILAQVTAAEFERADSSGNPQHAAAAAAAAVAAALGGGVESCHHRGQICRFFYVAELDRILTAADDGLVLTWDPATLQADAKPVHRGPRPIVDTAFDERRNVFLLVQDDGCLLLYGVREERAGDESASVRLLGCYAPETLSSLEQDTDGKPRYPGAIKSRNLRTRLLPATTIDHFPKGASSFITAVDFLPPDSAHSDFLILAGTQNGNVCFIRLTLPSSMHRTEVYHVMSAELGAVKQQQHSRVGGGGRGDMNLHGGQVTRIVLLKTKHLFCSVALDGTLLICDWERRNVLHRLLPNGAPPHARPILGVAVDNLNFYAFVWIARSVSVWDCITGVRVAMLSDNAHRVIDVAVDAEERLAFVLMEDKSINVVSTRTWKIIGKAEDGLDMFRPIFNKLTSLFWWKERGLLVSGGSVPFAWRRRFNNTESSKKSLEQDEQTQQQQQQRSSLMNKKGSDRNDDEEDDISALLDANMQQKETAMVLPRLLSSISGGHLVAVGPEVVHVWSARDCEEFNVWYNDASDVVTAAAMDPDGLRLVVGTESNRILFMNYAKGFESVELRHKEHKFNGVVALQIAAVRGEESLRRVCAALRRKLLIWIRDTQLYHALMAPDHEFELPETVDGNFTCLSLVHSKRCIFAAGTSAGRIILFSENLAVLNHFDMSATPLRSVQSIMACDPENGLFVAFGIGGNASLFGIRRVSNDAFMIVRSFQTTPNVVSVERSTATTASAQAAPAAPAASSSSENELRALLMTRNSKNDGSLPTSSSLSPGGKKSTFANAMSRLKAKKTMAEVDKVAAAAWATMALDNAIAVGDSQGNISVIGIASLAMKKDASSSNVLNSPLGAARKNKGRNQGKNNNNNKNNIDEGSGHHLEDNDDDAEKHQQLGTVMSLREATHCREGAASALFNSGAETLLHCCFKAHFRGITEMALSHVDTHIFTLGEDMALRLWRHNHILGQPWELVREISYPSSVPLAASKSISRYLPTQQQTQEQQQQRQELNNNNSNNTPSKITGESIVRNLIACHPLAAENVSEIMAMLPTTHGAAKQSCILLPAFDEMSGVTAINGKMLVPAGTLATIDDGKKRRESLAQQMKMFSAAATAISATAKMKTLTEIKAQQVARANTPQPPQNRLANAHYTSPVAASSTTSLSALQAQLRHVLPSNANATPKTRHALPPMVASSPSSDHRAARTPLPRSGAAVHASLSPLAGATPSLSSPSPSSAPLLVVMDERAAFERVAAQIARSIIGSSVAPRGGLIRNDIGDEKIATAVRDIHTLELTKASNHHGAKVEPPRAFSMMATEPVDHLANNNNSCNSNNKRLSASSTNSSGDAAASSDMIMPFSPILQPGGRIPLPAPQGITLNRPLVKR